MTAKKTSKPKRPARQQTSRYKRIAILYLASLAVTATAAVIAGILSQAPTDLPDPYRAEQRSAVTYQLFYPKRLPEGYEISQASLGRVESNIVTMRIRSATSEDITITQQKTPPGFNFDTLYNSFNQKSSHDLPLGKATIGTINNGQLRLASLVIEDTWVLVQTTQATSVDTIVEILKQLQASK